MLLPQNNLFMKRILVIAVSVTTVFFASCSGAKKEPNRIYMPDMTYSRAYESFPTLDEKVFTNVESQAGGKIYYDRRPVSGTVKRGQMDVAHLTLADTAGGNALTNPYSVDTSLKARINTEMPEATRLFNIYCAICHGTDMKGQGPLVASGKYSAAAANLTLDKFHSGPYPDGRVFHTISYGKGQMGGYASQLNNQQRWMLVNYIRTKQKPAIATKDSIK
jgi:mono/diheme cytochrome c family protein